jgi:hypothetical protein
VPASIPSSTPDRSNSLVLMLSLRSMALLGGDAASVSDTA